MSHPLRYPLSVGVLALTLGASVLLAPGAKAGAGATFAPTNSSVLTVPDSAYPVPSNALFVAPAGNDANPGTQAMPKRTLKAALAKVPTGGTVVARAGTYRESLGSITRRVTLQAYPHEQVWLKGSQVVTGWTKLSNTWIVSNWSTSLCATCYPASEITSAAPAAGLPDQVFIDGVMQRQVLSASAVTPGTFYVDRTAKILRLGTDPTGHTVEATVSAFAVQFNTAGAAGSVVRGVGFAHYGANSINSRVPAMVIVTSPSVSFDRDIFAYSATRALALLGTAPLVTNSVITQNGYTGVTAYKAHGLRFDTNMVTDNNNEHFSNLGSAAAATAGMKLASTDDAVVRNSVFDNNDSNGLWFDLACYRATVVNNVFRHNNGHGLFLEVSGSLLAASNVANDNRGYGIEVSGSADVGIWNNTLADNAAGQLGVMEDPRHTTATALVQRGITYDTARVDIVNNLLVDDHGGSPRLLKTYGGSNHLSADTMIRTHADNGWARASAAAPSSVAIWVRSVSPYNPSFTSLTALRSAVGQEVGSWERAGYGTSPLFVNSAGGDYHLLGNAPARGQGSALPAAVAQAIGVASGVPVDQGALIFAG